MQLHDHDCHQEQRRGRRDEPMVVHTLVFLVLRRLCCVARSVDRRSRPSVVSDRISEFGERRGDPHPVAGVDAEFVVAAAQVLQEGVTGDHHLGRSDQSVTRASCGVQILSQGRDLGIVRGLPDDGVLKMNAFK
jgi:hypothetical protein